MIATSTSSFTAKPLTLPDLLSFSQFSRAELDMLLATAAHLKREPKAFRAALEDKTIVLLFEKDSLRTLVSFEAGIAKLGGKAVYLDHRTSRIGVREPVRDYALNLERWTDAIVARTFEQATIDELAQHASIPVINALSNLEHPCQALADWFTLREHLGTLEGARLCYIGDGNNVCHSLMFGAALLGAMITVITPAGYEPLPCVIAAATAIAVHSGAKIVVSNDINDAANHHAVYTDTWTSMGQEAETAKRLAVFGDYQVTPDVMNAAGPGAVFMHCLPAHRGQEVAAEVIDSNRSVVYDQAENRMHAQNALLVHLLGGTMPKPRKKSIKPRVAVEV